MEIIWRDAPNCLLRGTVRDDAGTLTGWLTAVIASDGRVQYQVERIADGEMRMGFRSSLSSAREAAEMVAALFLSGPSS